ncbi:ubiquitin-protein ligase [Lithospermum erythrorhizon]|uniref:RBR-type E3 ubiquitin transferase n=1 Tax=Lithospermum erythrorhizon TaxID=34254 RepID=A0AAV3PC87_LITER
MNSTEEPEKPTTTTTTIFTAEEIDSDDEIIVVSETLIQLTCSNSESEFEDDEPLDFPPKFDCKICETRKPIHDIFRVKGCDHFYCSTCIAQHVTCNIKESVTQVTCPFSGCNQVLQPENCKDILPPEVYDQWGDLLCEEAIMGCERLNCPFEGCGGLVINDGDVVRECECPYCFRLFCVKCRVPWHADIDCATFQMRN